MDRQTAIPLGFLGITVISLILTFLAVRYGHFGASVFFAVMILGSLYYAEVRIKKIAKDKGDDNRN